MFKATWKRPTVALGALLAGCALAGCDFFENKWAGEFNAGGVDPYNFPPPYRGAGGVRHIAASGVFREIGARANGKEVGYFLFPFAPNQVNTTNYPAPAAAAWPAEQIDPLRVSGPGTDFRKTSGNPAPTPLVYNFDPPGGASPFPEQSRCKAPEGYTYDRFKDAYSKNEQWNVFTFLPDRFTSFPFGALATWSYRPVVAEVAVGSKDVTCQDIKSERTLLSYADQGRVDLARSNAEPDGTRLGNPTGRYLAWAVIDPGAAVVRVGQDAPDVLEGGNVTGTGVQKYGWYNQFILAYIDGGYIPVEDGPVVEGAPTKQMRPQRLYFPRSRVLRVGADKPTPGALGQGYDVLQADRFTDGEAYSPVCEVWTYSLPGDTPEAELPRTEADIIATAGATLEPARTQQSSSAFTPSATIVPRYVFCLQASPLPPKS